MEVGGAVITPIVESLIKKLGAAFWKELELVWGVKDNLRKLESLLLTINGVLEDAEMKSFTEIAIRKWLKDLKHVALDAEDVINEFHTEALWRANVVRGTVKGKVHMFFSSHNSLAFSLKMAHRIKSIVGRFSEITEEMSKFNLLVSGVQARRAEVETSSCVDETGILGRDEDKKNVKEWVINRNNDEEVSVLPIIGLGGVGKTTLARIVFNDEEMEKHFDIKVWVFVGKAFEVIDITRKILELITNEKCKLSTLQGLQTLLREKLEGKLFLLVLDDVWNENESKWEDLQTSLRNHRQGNKMIVTSRSQKVAEIMRTTSSVHNLEVLSGDDCWDLFSRRAFRVGLAEVPANLVKIGKEIVNKCGGLPLVAKSLGSVMATKRDEAEWRAVRDSELWRLGDEVEGFLPALRLSYDHLSPPQLKQCFTYCAIFPKDFEIVKLELIQLWIAQGFIESKDGMLVEDIGTRYFNGLLDISFFQEPKKDKFGDVIVCKVHDLVHDLACSIGKDEFGIFEFGGASSLPSECRHLPLDGRDPMRLSTIVELSLETRKLRSILIPRTQRYRMEGMLYPMRVQFPWHALKNFSLLRVLDLSYTETSEVPSAVGKYLKHLKYLNLSGTNIKSLPESITKLRSLQTLRLRDCSSLEKLPRRLQDLCNLMHLDISGYVELRSMPRGLSRLTNLVSLSRFVVGAGPNHSKLADLKHLNQLRGKLCLEGLANVEDPQQAEAANLSLKINLRRLTLSGATEVAILESLRPPLSLKKLKIERYGGNTYPLWLTQLDLVYLSLINISRCERLPYLGQFSSLLYLDIRGMDNLKEVGEELYGIDVGESGKFSSLKEMRLGAAPELETWYVPPERELFPALEVLNISGCLKLRVSPCLPSSIVELTIEMSNEELLRGSCLQGLSRLRKLEIWCMSASSSETNWEGLWNLTALEELGIYSCDNLICLPKGVVQHHFPTLRTLVLFSMTSLESLGGGEGESPSEEEEEEEAPPPLFLSLRNLQIRYCLRLSKLPEWMRGLQSLQNLTIGGSCPELAERCERETGEDWDKICHIPVVNVWPYIADSSSSN